jgi:hypothetical protein
VLYFEKLRGRAPPVYAAQSIFGGNGGHGGHGGCLGPPGAVALGDVRGLDGPPSTRTNRFTTAPRGVSGTSCALCESLNLGPLHCRRLSAEAPNVQGQSAYHSKMNTVRLRHLIAVAGFLTASAVLHAPTALGQPVDCFTDPTNSACLTMPGVTPTSPGAPLSPNDPRCIAQPGNGVCAGGPYAPDSMPGTIPGAPPGSPPGTLPGTIPGAPPGSPPGTLPGTIPGAPPGSPPGTPPGGGMGGMGGMGGI